MIKRADFLKSWDFPLLAAGLGLVFISGLTMASAAQTVNPALAGRHWAWSGLAVAACLAASRINYLRWIDGALLLYGMSLLALLLVQFVGPTRLGATRWLSLFGLSIQPSEVAKISTIIFLARLLSAEASPLSWRALGLSALVAWVPAGLIFIQPDLGSATIIIVIWVGMIAAAGASRRHLIFLGLSSLLLSPFAWLGLKSYQRDRLMVFLNPQIDPLGAGYTIIQSIVAIGSGCFFGRGWRSGTQNQLSFLPERHSDFIFSVIGEEWGLVGCLIVLGLFVVLLKRISLVGFRTTEPGGRLIAAGVFSWVAYQAFVNMGMVMGILPVVGIPLPLVSFGGSSMVMLWTAFGLLHNINRSQKAP